MRLALLPLAILAASLAAGGAPTPAHLKQLPDTVLHRGQAPVALAAAKAGERTWLWLPGGERAFEVERVVEAPEATTRFGRIPGVGSAAITLGAGGGFGRVTEGTTVWFLEYRDGDAWAVRAGEGGLALADYDDGARGPAPPTPAAMSKAAAPSRKAEPRTIDVLGLYDADFAARYPGALAAARIAHFVALANQAFVDSDVAVTLRVVHTQAATGAVEPSALDNIDSLYVAQSGGTFAGVNVLGLRLAHGADLATFFRVHDLYARGVCGVAQFPVDRRTGINVVMDGASGGSICDDYTFAHEVGHNLGARHQRAADPTSARGHAFVRPGQFGTIMRSFGTGRPDRYLQLGYFSNPRIACGNLACGTAGTEDNAGAMDDNAALVASYVVSAVAGAATRPAPVNADSDGDGVIDRIDAFPFDPLESVDADGDGHPASRDAFPDNSTEWLDSDGGGLGDNADPDDDNDGVPDGADLFPTDPLEWADADGDGWGDNGDAFDADPREQRDSDGDGTGDRGDPDDDQDGQADVAVLTSIADGELLVADDATDRILRFRGSDFAPLGTLVQLEPGAVTFRSGMAAAESGELYFVGASQLRVLDRLRSATPTLMLDTASHPQVGTGFPMSPVVLASGDVLLGEMGVGAVLVLRPAPSAAAVTALRRIEFGTAPHLTRNAADEVYLLDGASGMSVRWTFSGDPMISGPTASFAVGTVTPQTSGGIAAQSMAALWWVDRVTGQVRGACLAACAVAPPTLSVPGGAAAVAYGPDQKLYVAVRNGGVRRFDAGDGADEGMVVPAATAAEPLALAWAPRILDPLPAIAPPPPPATVADASITPATGGTTPPAPPCTTACIDTGSGGGGGGGGGGSGGGGGGAPDAPFALLALLLLLQLERRQLLLDRRVA